jgi:hypothetical protein
VACLSADFATLEIELQKPADNIRGLLLFAMTDVASKSFVWIFLAITPLK